MKQVVHFMRRRRPRSNANTETHYYNCSTAPVHSYWSAPLWLAHNKNEINPSHSLLGRAKMHCIDATCHSCVCEHEVHMISHGAFDDYAIFPTHFVHFDIEARATQEQCTGLNICLVCCCLVKIPPNDYGECLLQSTLGRGKFGGRITSFRSLTRSSKFSGWKIIFFFNSYFCISFSTTPLNSSNYIAGWTTFDNFGKQWTRKLVWNLSIAVRML